MEIVPHKNLLQPKQGNGGETSGEFLPTTENAGRGGENFFGRTGYDGLVRGKRSFPPFLRPMANAEIEIRQLGRKSPPRKTLGLNPNLVKLCSSLFTTADAAVVIFHNSPHPPHFLFCSRFSSGSAITSALSLSLFTRAPILGWSVVTPVVVSNSSSSCC